MAEVGVGVAFFLKAVQNNFKTAQEGRPIFEDREYIRILVAGDKGTIVEQPLRPEDKERFAAEYRAWKQGLAAPVVGTPIGEWPLVGASQVEELKALHVQTVEALAALSEAGIGGLGLGGRQLRDKAVAWLAATKDAAPLAQLVEERDLLRADNELLQAQIAEMNARLKELEEGRAPARGGRKAA